MVDITPLIRSDRKVIQAYKNGVFKISNVIYEHPVIVFPDRVQEWPVAPDQIVALDDLTEHTAKQPGLAESMASVTIRPNEVEFLLLGTGLIMHPLQPALRDWFKAHNIRCEAMDTGAACRTYNVLMAEGRLVAAALLLSH